MNYKELTGQQLVGQWKRLVNDNVSVGRDAHLLKDALLRYTPPQLLLGMYIYKNERTVSIPQFLRQSEQWLVDDDSWAEVELAIKISSKTPPEYYTYMDFREEETTAAYQQSNKARQTLQSWADRILE